MFVVKKLVLGGDGEKVDDIATVIQITSVTDRQTDRRTSGIAVAYSTIARERSMRCTERVRVDAERDQDNREQKPDNDI